MDGMTHDSKPQARLCSFQSVILICILPFANICGFLWCYTALPLHFVDSQWPLWQLSLLLTLVYIPRVVVTLLTPRIGDYVCVPISLVAALLNVYMVLQPQSLTAVWIAVGATCTALQPPTYRSFVYVHFADTGEWQLQRAQRIYTFADTLGYACAPFIGGLLYDFGGLRACAGFATATCGSCALLPLLLDAYWQSFAKIYRRSRRAPARSSSEPTEEQSPQAVGSAAAVVAGEGRQTMALGSSVEAYYRWPVAVVMVAVFSNICIYGVEWCLYALYFRIQYGWSGAWCGFAQMIGDLIGGAVLGLSTMSCVTHRAARLPLPLPARALLRPPFSLVLLACSHGALMLMLGQPNFLVSLLGQILMGTAYVFFEQGLQEMLLLYSHGDHTFYRRLISIHYLAFTAGCALCSPVAFGLYGYFGAFSSAFFGTGIFAFTLGAVLAVYYAGRLAPTPGGLFGSLAAAEQHLLDKRVAQGPADRTPQVKSSARVQPDA